MKEASREASLLEPRVLFPFIIITLIWGSTWIVIKDQLGSVPAPWSVTYRFLIAATAMFALACWRGQRLGLDGAGHRLALAFGIPQFALNFNFVYEAEKYVTSGLVAVTFALLLVPNSLLGRIFLGRRLSRRFMIGSLIACGGVGLLFLNEIRASDFSPDAVRWGLGLTLLAILSASVSNVMQASEGAGRYPMFTLIGWGMAYGAILDAVLAFALSGPPVIEWRLGYWAGLLYLGLAASALAFSLYYPIIRAVGPGPAAYSSLIVPVLAMSFSTALEGYHWSWLAVGGAILAAIGLLVALRSPKPAIPASS